MMTKTLQGDKRRATDLKQVRVIINPKSGLKSSFDALRIAMDRHWETPDREITYQFTQSLADSERKVLKAIDEGIDLLLVAGSDGTLSSVGRLLVGTDVCLGTIPTGSGNGMARHFGIPLSPDGAASALASGRVLDMDVGMLNDRPFFITCSMAWDAAIVRSFEKMPVRGILPYVFAGVYEFFEYRTQPVTLVLDDQEAFTVADPLVCTVANLSQYGGGAVIAPTAQPDDGILELVIARRKDVPMLIANLGRLISGTVQDIPQVIHRRFRSLVARRPKAAPVQVDGELIDCPAELTIACRAGGIRMLVPTKA
jgi:diacylglycerol kinase (ATP)